MIAARLTVLGIAALALTACGSAEQAAEDLVNQQLSGSASVDIGEDGAFSLGGSDGSFQYGTGELPADWPASLPAPAGFSLVTAYSMDNTVGATFQADGDQRAAVADYVASLADSGWTPDPTYGEPLPDVYFLVGDEGQLTIMASITDDVTGVIFTLTK